MSWFIRLMMWSTGFLALGIPRSLRSTASELPSVAGSSRYEKISVVIPARNEASSLPLLLESISRQTLPPVECVVVDDASHDETADIAAEFGALVLRSEAPPEGWTGKNYACWVGANNTSGEIVCFVDADVRLGEDALEFLARCHQATGGLVSVVPFHSTERAYEGISAIFNIVATMGTGQFSPLRRMHRSVGSPIASGPMMMCSREDYGSVGGHRAVATEVVDDLELGRRFVDEDLPLDCLFGGRDVVYRMYPEGLPQVIEGWSKNFAIGASRIRPFMLALTFVWMTGALTASLLVSKMVLDSLAGDLDVRAAGVVVAYYATYAVQLWWFGRVLGRFPMWSWLLFPVALFFFICIFLVSSAQIAILRRVRWKGRTVSTRVG